MNKTLEKEIISRAVDSIKKGSNIKIGVLVLLILSLTGIALTSYLPFYLLSIASMFLTVLFIGADSNFFKKRIILNDYIIKMKANIIKK